MIRKLFHRLVSWNGFLATLFICVLALFHDFRPSLCQRIQSVTSRAGVSEKAILLLPMALLIIAREIDLSVASILAYQRRPRHACSRAGSLAAIPLVLVDRHIRRGAERSSCHRSQPPFPGCDPGHHGLVSGIGYIMLGTHSVNELSDALTNFGINSVCPTAIPWTIVPFVVLAPIFATMLHRTALGRRIYAIGGNPDVALYSGVRIRWLRFGLFVISGLMCALAGIVFTARLSNARADNAIGFELDVITITLLGGISVFWRPRQSHWCSLGARPGRQLFVTFLGSIESAEMDKVSSSASCSFLAVAQQHRAKSTRQCQNTAPNQNHGSATIRVQRLALIFWAPAEIKSYPGTKMHKLLSSTILLGALFVTTAFGADATAKPATVGFIPKLDTVLRRSKVGRRRGSKGDRWQSDSGSALQCYGRCANRVH